VPGEGAYPDPTGPASVGSRLIWLDAPMVEARWVCTESYIRGAGNSTLLSCRATHTVISDLLGSGTTGSCMSIDPEGSDPSVLIERASVYGDRAALVIGDYSARCDVVVNRCSLGGGRREEPEFEQKVAVLCALDSESSLRFEYSSIVASEGAEALVVSANEGRVEIIGNSSDRSRNALVSGPLRIRAREIEVRGCEFRGGSGSGCEFAGSAFSIPDGERLTLAGCLFAHNEVVSSDTGDGDLIEVNGIAEVEVIDCTFELNTVASGAVFRLPRYFFYHELGESWGCSFRGCAFFGNVTKEGAIAGTRRDCTYGIPWSVEDCRFIDNVATAREPYWVGGAIFEPCHRLKWVRRSLFDGNESLWGFGGAIVGGCDEISSCVFVGNRSERGASAIYGLAGRLENCTFSRNTSASEYWTSVMLFESSVSNCVFWGDLRSGLDPALLVYCRDSSVRDCVIEGGPAGYLGADSTFSGIIDADPLFNMDKQFGSLYSLLPGSPAIDTGSNDFVPMGADLAGNPRVARAIGPACRIDLGAYEFQGEPCWCPGDKTTSDTNLGDAYYGEPDGEVNGADLSYYVEHWLAKDVPWTTDVTTTDTNPGDAGYGIKDGATNGADLSFFVESWLQGCLTPDPI